MSEHAVPYGKNRINFLLERKARKRIKISVMPDLLVGVSVPDHVPIEKVLNRVQRRASWIVKQINYFKEFMPHQPPRRYISGETHYYLGRQYRLKVVRAKTHAVKLKGKYIYVHSLRPESGPRTRRLMYEWYRSRAQRMFEIITERCHSKLDKYGIKLPAIDVKTMKARWGSCIHMKGRIGLNTELIKAPSHCVEYVIVHEMCHLKYPNHTKRFYSFLTLVMPDWGKRKERLEKVLI